MPWWTDWRRRHLRHANPEILKLQADIIAAVNPFVIETAPIGAFAAVLHRSRSDIADFPSV
jgi:hypothetical protein